MYAWIIGLLLLVGLIWIVADTFDDEPEREVAVVETPILEEERVVNDAVTGVAAAGPISEFVAFTENDETTPDMGLDHEYTSEGLLKLKAALDALAVEQGAGDANIQQKKQELQQAADKIQQDPQSLQHANTIKDAFVKASNLLETIQQKNFPDLDDSVAEVKSAAESIDTSTQTLNQKDQVKKFFDEAGDALQEMAANTATTNR